jgi:hypothetical protein
MAWCCGSALHKGLAATYQASASGQHLAAVVLSCIDLHPPAEVIIELDGNV